MTKITVKKIHECRKPDIPKVFTCHVYYVRKLPWFRKTKLTDETWEYKFTEAKWECPDYNSKWLFSAWKDTGFWVCEDRTEEWIELEL